MDKQTGKFIARIAENLPQMSPDVMQGWIENPKGLKKFLSGLVPPVDNVATDFNSFFRTRSGLWVSDSFRDLVLSHAEPAGPVVVKHFDLPSDMLDSEVEERFSKLSGGNHFFTEGALCGTIKKMIEKQWGGKPGRLLNNGYANLFYLLSCLVRVGWDADDRKWSVGTWHRDDRKWSIGAWRGDRKWSIGAWRGDRRSAGWRVFSPAT